MYGRRLLQPRLTAVCGRSMDPSSRYRRPRADAPWTPMAAAIRRQVADQLSGYDPNGLIANRYRTGQIRSPGTPTTNRPSGRHRSSSRCRWDRRGCCSFADAAAEASTR